MVENDYKTIRSDSWPKCSIDYRNDLKVKKCFGLFTHSLTRYFPVPSLSNLRFIYIYIYFY